MNDEQKSEETTINNQSAASLDEADALAALRAENNELNAVIRMREARDKITASLKTARARSPELMFDAAKESLQFGDDGALENADAIVADLKRKFPEQFGSERVSAPPIDGGAGTGRQHDILTKEALAKMKPAEIARLDWDEVRQVLSAN